jgi:hypothetical protein
MNARSELSILFIVLGMFIPLGSRASGIFDFLSHEGENDITAVASAKSKAYIRVELANGTFVPESYVFGPGGVWSGQKVDSSIDKLTFSDVAHMIAGPLASQNFVPDTDPITTKLLIMVYWGTSHGDEHPTNSNGYQNLQQSNTAVSVASMAVHEKPSPINYEVLHQAQDAMATALSAVAAENKMRDEGDALNVNMLGYASWWQDTERFENTPMRFRRQDLIDEIEEDRYFVVLMAYDFQALRRHKKAKLLWETRFSIRERHHAFNEDLPAMAQYASQFFGQDSHGLVHKEVPMGHVNIGAVKSIGDVPEMPGVAPQSQPKP